MSDQFNNIGSTLTGGIQDISALLPLIGTEQCERHVGSALDGGYLYAAFAPLSIFGSLGITKAGISVLIASISITVRIPYISFSPSRKLSLTFPRRRWSGAKVLKDAGFQLPGTVAPMIGMHPEKNQFFAESKIIEMVEEKHIDDPSKITIKTRRREWNIGLVLSTIIAAMLSGTPYIYLILKGQIDSVKNPWIYPFLRTIGSCFASVCCQFLFQFRQIRLMKTRVIFMAINHLHADDLKSGKMFEGSGIQWDENTPAEECFWSLEHYVAQESLEARSSSLLDVHNKLREKYGEHLSAPVFDRVSILLSWLLLLLAIPASIAGYIGCFTLVTDSRHRKAPIIWLGLEAVLSLIRILVWAWNPSFDETTGVTAELELTKEPPSVTTQLDMEHVKEINENRLPLMSERKFLEWITPFTGPVEQFQSPDSKHLPLFFTHVAISWPRSDGKSSDKASEMQKCLYLTIFDVNKRIGMTMLEDKNGKVICVEASITSSDISNEMLVELGPEIPEDHPRLTNLGVLLESLQSYYLSLLCSVRDAGNRNRRTAALPWKWSFLPNANQVSGPSDQNYSPIPASISLHEEWYLHHGFEQALKVRLMEKWGSWNQAYSDDMHRSIHYITREARSDIYDLEKRYAKECARREVSLAELSARLEDILSSRLKTYIGKNNEPEHRRLNGQMLLEFKTLQQKRLEAEKRQAQKRMLTAWRSSFEFDKERGEKWISEPFDINDEKIDKNLNTSLSKDLWHVMFAVVVDMWRSAITNRDGSAVRKIESDRSLFLDLVDQGLFRSLLAFGGWDTWVDPKPLNRGRFQLWVLQGDQERQKMEVLLKHVEAANSSNIEEAYAYPLRFGAWVRHYYSPALSLEHKNRDDELVKMSCASVYSLKGCDADVFWKVIEKNTTHSLLDVGLNSLEVLYYSLHNDHLFYIRFSQESSVGNKIVEKVLNVLEENKSEWVLRQNGNAWTFYLSPDRLDKELETLSPQYSPTWVRNGTIAQIILSISAPARVRLRVSHRLRALAEYVVQGKIEIREEGSEVLARVLIKENDRDDYHCKWTHIDLPSIFGCGRHDLSLSLVDMPTAEDSWSYSLSDIAVEFLDEQPLVKTWRTLLTLDEEEYSSPALFDI